MKVETLRKCDTKLKFSSKSTALTAARNHGERHNQPTQVYYCEPHLCWHLTTKGKSE